jgi:hypothetical protein
MPRAINQPPPNVDELVIEYHPDDEAPGEIRMVNDGRNLWLVHNGKPFARRENRQWVNITDN